MDEHWVNKRLNELGKTKRQFADAIGVPYPRINGLVDGSWHLQIGHIRAAAEFLMFDRTALLDFLSGDITEEELWNYQPPQQITSQELEILRMIRKSQTPDNNNNNNAAQTG